MKFLSLTQISSSPFQYWAFPYDAQDILEPSHLLFDLYSMLHNQQPRNADPNISVSVEETQFAVSVKSDLSTSLPTYSHSGTVDIQHVREHGLYSQLPLKFEHSHYYKSELSNHGFFSEYHLVEHDNDTSSPTLSERTFYLHYGWFFDNRPYRKSMKFIETKVAAMKLQGFNH